jgi:hypothetical protein
MYLRLVDNDSGSLINQFFELLRWDKGQGLLNLVFTAYIFFTIAGFIMRQTHFKKMRDAGVTISARVKSAAIPTFMLIMSGIALYSLYLGLDWSQIATFGWGRLLETKGKNATTFLITILMGTMIAIWYINYLYDWWYDVKQSWWGTETTFQKFLRWGSLITSILLAVPILGIMLQQVGIMGKINFKAD